MRMIFSATTASLALFVAPVVLAQTVYESTNEQGVVEFSDQPSSGASAVTVNPNVIETAPTPEIEAYQRPEPKQAESTTSPPVVESETEYSTTTNNRLRRHAVREHNSPGPVTPHPAPAPRAPLH